MRRLLLIVLFLLSPSLLAEEVLLKPEAFIAGAFPQSSGKMKTLWLNDEQKTKAIENIEDMEPPLLRHFIMRCVLSFLKMPNDHLIAVYKEKVARI